MSFQKAQTFQIFSSGADGLYGVGGPVHRASSASSTASNALPLDATNTVAGGSASTDGSIRQREQDNLTNFQAGTLQ